MKKKDIQALKNATKPELEKRLLEARENLRTLTFSKNAGKLKNPHEITMTRKHIARMETALKTQELGTRN